jgi:DNA anti-recombination protein RmuC
VGEWNWQRFYSELKYIVSTGVALAGAAIVVNQELTKAKIEGVVMEVARMGQQVDHMEEKLEEMEKKMGQRVDCMEEKLEEMEKKMGQRVDRMEEKLEEMEKKMGQRVDRMEEKLENMEKKMDQKFDQMEQKMDMLIQQFPNAWPWSHGRR